MSKMSCTTIVLTCIALPVAHALPLPTSTDTIVSDVASGKPPFGVELHSMLRSGDLESSDAGANELINATNLEELVRVHTLDSIIKSADIIEEEKRMSSSATDPSISNFVVTTPKTQEYPDGYPFYADGQNPTMVKRHVMDELPSNVLYSWPSAAPEGASFTVSADGKFVTMPLGARMVAGFAQTNSAPVEFKKAGIANMKWVQNNVSIVTDRPFVGWASKEMTTKATGLWSTEAADKAKADMRSQTDLQKQQAMMPEVRSARDAAAQGAFLGLLYNGLGEAGLDWTHVKNQRDYASSSDAAESAPTVLAEPRVTALKESASEEAGAFGTKQAVMTEDVCMHLEKAPGMNLNQTSETITLPLRKPIVYATGRQSYSPMLVLNVLRGIALFDVDPMTGSLVMYSASSASQWLEGEYIAPTRAGLYLSPPAPTLSVSPIDGREFGSVGRGNSILRRALDQYKLLPADYTRTRVLASDLCSAEDAKAVKSLMDQDPPSGRTSAATSVLEVVKGKLLPGKGADCAQNYVRSVEHGVEQAYNVEVFGILTHMASEYLNLNPHAPHARYDAMASREWGHGVL